MKRREALKRTSAILGIAISGPAITGILQGCTADTSSDFTPRFLSQGQLELTAELADRIIPRTDTSGAKDVFVERFIDKMLFKVFPTERKERFINGLHEIELECDAQFKKPFKDCEDVQKDTLLRKKESEAYQILQTEENPPRPFFLLLKELVLLGFFTSEKGIKSNLDYDPVPGDFQGCIPLKENQKVQRGNHV